MKRYLSLLPLMLLLPLLAVGSNDNDKNKSVAAPSWTIDKTHTSVNFKVNHFFTPVSGSFEDYTVDLKFDPKDLKGSSVDVVIKVKSVNTKNEKRDGHLQSEDFFNAEKFENITFKSTTLEKTGENTFVAKGKLTIKDTTKDFELPFTFLGMADHPWQQGTLVAGMSSSFVIKRNDYGVGTGDWVATAVVGDDVSVDISVEVTRKK